MSDKALNLVLDLRKREEDEALELLLEAQNNVASFERQIAQLKEFENIYIEEMKAKSQFQLDMGTYLAYQQFINKLERIKERQEAGLVKLQEQENRARSNYLDKQQQRKIIESLIEKHRLERERLEARAEQKLSDDIVSSKQARLLIEKMK